MYVNIVASVLVSQACLSSADQHFQKRIPAKLLSNGSNAKRKICKMHCPLVRDQGYGAQRTFNNIPVISWRSILLVDEPRVPGENHRPAASHGQTLSHNVVTLVVICTDYIGSYKYNQHRIRTTTVHHCSLVSAI